MCLALPMQIIEINGTLACCQSRGIERQVSLFLLRDEALQVGDHVMVHVGYAIQKVCQEEAQLAWELHDQMVAQDAPDRPSPDSEHA